MMTDITPINTAEAVFEPFWDEKLSGLRQWKVAPGKAHGLRVWQSWCYACFEWARKPAEGPALSMARDFDVDCSDYAHLLVSAQPPEGAVLRVRAETDRGAVAYEAPPAGSLKREYAIDLQGAKRIKKIALEIETSEDSIQSGNFNWIGLQAPERLERHLAQWKRFDESWRGYLKPEGFQPTFKPTVGMLLGDEELAALRRRHEMYLRETDSTPLLDSAREAMRNPPEELVGEYVNFWSDTRYCRERDHGRVLLNLEGGGLHLALAGLVLRDGAMLRMAARYAMSLAMCEHWDDGFICRFPGSIFEHRCFVQSLVTLEVAAILDLAGEWFTDLGRVYAMRRIAEEGLASIVYNTWRWEYIFQCNQLAIFSAGRMAGALFLERHWPRAGAAAEQAYADVVESLGYAILPDGGYAEGPSYSTTVGHWGGLALYLYARARGKRFEAIVPESVRRMGDFAAAVASTDEDADAIPICDSRNRLGADALAAMATILPRSQWAAMFRKSLERTGGAPVSMI